MPIVHLDYDAAYTDIDGLFSAIYKRLTAREASPDCVFDKDKVYVSQDIQRRVVQYYVRELSWSLDKAFTLWLNKGPYASPSIINFAAVIRADDWVQENQQQQEDT